MDIVATSPFMFADMRHIGVAVARYGRCRPVPDGDQEVDRSAMDVESPSNANAKPLPNDRLKDRIRAKGLSPQRFATLADVTLKTVQRWLANTEANVQEHNAQRAADVLGCTPHDLWPAKFPPSNPAQSPVAAMPGPFTATFYASRTQVPINVWRDHFTHAQTSIDILVIAATFLFDTLDGFLDTLLAATERGVTVRFLVGAPDSQVMTLRGEEEGIGESVIARSRNSVELLAPYDLTPGLHIRTHQTTLYSSIFRVDDAVIVNFHIYGSPGRNNPVMLLSRHEEPRLWATLERAFTRVWDNATPLPESPDTSPLEGN